MSPWVSFVMNIKTTAQSN